MLVSTILLPVIKIYFTSISLTTCTLIATYIIFICTICILLVYYRLKSVVKCLILLFSFSFILRYPQSEGLQQSCYVSSVFVFLKEKICYFNQKWFVVYHYHCNFVLLTREKLDYELSVFAKWMSEHNLFWFIQSNEEKWNVIYIFIWKVYFAEAIFVNDIWINVRGNEKKIITFMNRYLAMAI